MDNHESHCSLEAILFAKNNGIALLTFPPHCSHRLQPLDVGVLGPFKAKFKVASNDWLLNHSGRTISLYSIIEIVGTAYAASFTIHNIKQGFKKPGIWRINRNAFCDEDFESSFITDRPSPVNIPSNNICSAQVNVQNTFNDASPTDVPNSSNNEPIPKSPSVQQNHSSVSQPGPSGIQ
ncbi:hypothetical protein NQ314_006964 [Rhamnusium bicolor]|uniref:DDE-1 domain-containing protein n=1 Tax=Rhamnusium bicolor TaxID=1586634 RepID=A0AAV8YTV7_9CUCU|nr:hypothetical protein NQ314_006964 [Rhamnusium bicolor]